MDSEYNGDTRLIMRNFFSSLPFIRIIINPLGAEKQVFTNTEEATVFIHNVLSTENHDRQGVFGEISIIFEGGLTIHFEIRDRSGDTIPELSNSTYLIREAFVQLFINVIRNQAVPGLGLPDAFICAFTDRLVRHHPNNSGGGLEKLPADLRLEMIAFVTEMFADLTRSYLSSFLDPTPSYDTN